MVKCKQCGKEVALPFKCKYCGEYFCVEHHLPEKHNCPGLTRGVWQPISTERKVVGRQPRRRLDSSRITFRRPSPVAMLSPELKDLMIACGAVALVFLPLSGGIFTALPIVVVAVLSFLIHELAHRFVAIGLGHRASFRLSREGLVLTLVSAIPFMPIKFVAPGYVVVVFRGLYSRADEGKIAVSGPLANIVLASLGLLAASLGGGGLWAMTARINAYIGLFNLIPFFMLDGEKVMRWSMGVWAASFVTAVLILSRAMGFIF